MRLNDTLSGLLLILLGAGVAVSAWRFPSPAGQSIGPGLFPILAGIGIAGCGAALVQTGRKRPGVPWLELEEWVRRPRLVLSAGLVVVALIFYALAAETLGFFLTAAIFLVVLFRAFEVRQRWIAPLAVAVTLGLHVVFYTLLRVPLPWGWLEGLAW